MSEPSTRLSREQLTELKRVGRWRGLLSIVWTWAWIAAAFGLYIWRPGVLTFAIALVVVSGRHLALAILMHEGAHFLLHPNRATNDRISDWLCGYPIMLDTRLYRQVHFAHHKHTWTDKDPDRSLAVPFPVTRRSLFRKIVRDLSGQTGVKRYAALARFTAKRGFFLTNAMLLAALTLLGHPEAYLLLWLLPALTIYSLLLRLRSIAEHAAVSDPTTVLRQTRTTLSPWLVRFFIAPHHVNYHLEHHLYQFVPHYNLPALHRALMARGALADAEIVSGYLNVWRRASSRRN